jgi:hypothetical protein
VELQIWEFRIPHSLIAQFSIGFKEMTPILGFGSLNVDLIFEVEDLKSLSPSSSSGQMESP